MAYKHSTNTKGTVGKICNGYRCESHWCPLSGFFNEKNNTDGLSTICKACRAEYCQTSESKIRIAKNNKKYMQTLKGKFVGYKRLCRQRNRKFDLTFEEFCLLCTQPCYYCDKIQLPYNGIDRVDSSKGYVLDNCVSCCTICNQMKRDYSVKEFMTRCSKIVNKSMEIGNI